MEPTSVRNNSSSVRKALSIVECISQSADGATLEELSKKLGMNRSTLIRLMAPLQDYELVFKNPETGTYQMGIKALQWARISVSRLDVRKVAYPFMRDLMQSHNETVFLAIHDDAHIVYIDKVESQNTIRMVAQIGGRMPVHSTATGKAILAHLSTEEVEKVCKKGLKQCTPFTLTTCSQLKENLKGVRNLGYSIDKEENELGVVSIAAPIFDRKSHVIAAISIAGPSFRITPDYMSVLGESVKKAGMGISKVLGYPVDDK